jgi:hypothetical protein
MTIIIMLISIKWSEVPALVQYFSFALTLSSLLLALLAIVYSFYSSSISSQNVATFTNLSQTVQQSAISIENAANQINDQMATLPTHFKEVQSKVEETQVLFKELYGSQSPSSKTSQHKSSVPTEEQINEFLSKSSFSGLILLYACHLGTKGNKEIHFDLVQFTSKVLITSSSYAFGFLVACSALNLFSGNINTEKDAHIKQMSSYLADKVKLSITGTIEKQNSESKSIWLSILTSTEAYFS